MKNEKLNRIKEADPDFLDVTEKNGKPVYCCPVCHGTMWYHKEVNRYSCFRCDLMDQDYINLFALHENISVRTACKRLLAERPAGQQNSGDPFSFSHSHTGQGTPEHDNQNGNDTGRFFRRAIELKQNLYLPACKDFLRRRGFDPEEVEKYNVGFDPAFKDYKRPDGSYKTSPRFISYDDTGTYCTIRDTRPDNRMTAAERECKKRTPKGQRRFIFNEAALNDGADPVFLCEGVFDCLSVLVCGFKAASLNGINGWHTLIDETGKYKHKARMLIICFDYEQTAEKREIIRRETDKAIKGLNAAGCIVISGNTVSSPYKDINDLFAKDRDKIHDELYRLDRTARNIAMIHDI